MEKERDYNERSIVEQGINKKDTACTKGVASENSFVNSGNNNKKGTFEEPFQYFHKMDCTYKSFPYLRLRNL